MTYHIDSLSRVNDFAVFPGQRLAMLVAKARFMVLRRVVVLLRFSCVGVVCALTTFGANCSTLIRPLTSAIND